MIICEWIATSLPCVSGHNQFTNTKFTRPIAKISKSIDGASNKALFSASDRKEVGTRESGGDAVPRREINRLG